MESRVKDKAKKLGIEIATLDGQNRVPKQTADVEAAVAKKYGALLITHHRRRHGSGSPGSHRHRHAGRDRRPHGVQRGDVRAFRADNVLGGEQQGKALLALFPKGATIFELTGTPGATPAIDRSKGLHNIIDSHPSLFRYIAGPRRPKYGPRDKETIRQVIDERRIMESEQFRIILKEDVLRSPPRTYSLCFSQYLYPAMGSTGRPSPMLLQDHGWGTILRQFGDAKPRCNLGRRPPLPDSCADQPWTGLSQLPLHLSQTQSLPPLPRWSEADHWRS